MKMNGLLRLLLFQLFSISNVHAFNNTPVTYLGIENGLSNNVVTSIYQDHAGFMWFGTYDGLNRYDGYRFKIFRNVIGDTNSLASNNVYTMEGDTHHNIWVGGQKGVSVYNPVTLKFSTLKYHFSKLAASQTSDLNIHQIKKVGDGSMLVGSQHYGLFIFKNKYSAGEHVPLQFNNKTIVDYSVSAIEFDTINNSVYIFIQHMGLFSFDLQKKSFTLVSNSFLEGNFLKVAQGDLWFAHDKGLFKFDLRSKKYSDNFLPFNNKVVIISEDKKGVLWLASDGGGLLYLPRNGKQAVPFLSPRNQPLINSNAVDAIYEDREGRKWIGTLRGGINIIESRSSSFKNIVYDQPGKTNLVDNFIMSFCEDDGNLWIGTDGAGLRFWNRQTNTFSLYQNGAMPQTISSNFITSIIRDYENTIWVSTWFGGVNRYNRATKSFERFSCFNGKKGLVENNVWLVYEDRQHRLWASATNEGSLYLFNRQQKKFELFDESLVNLQCLAEDSQGNFWGGNYTSLIKIDRETRKHTVYNIGSTIRIIHEDINKNLWIGTQEWGLLLFDRITGKYNQFTTTDGLPNNTILRLLEDKSGNLWMSTYNGLSRFNTQTRKTRNFFQSDGLQSNQFSFNAGLAMTSGEFLFGGIKGFTLFYPDSIQPVSLLPPVVITGLRVNNLPVEDDFRYVTKTSFDNIEALEVPYDKAILSIDFAALEYTAPDKISYAYFLKGWDKEWNYVGNSRTAIYTHLPEGNYTLKIKSTNADGIWNTKETLLQFTVLPPWFRTWWAYITYAFVVAAFIYFYLNYKATQTKLRYKIKLAQLNAEKEREINEKKISFFTNVSHEFRTPLTLIINPIKELLNFKDEKLVSDNIQIIYRNSRRLLSLVDQLLLFKKADSEGDHLKLSMVNFKSLCKEVYLCFIQQAKSNSITYLMEEQDGDFEIYGDREKMEIILFNIISNALKYTPAGGKVVCKVWQTENEVQLSVADTGQGISPEVGDKLFERFYRNQTNNHSGKVGFGIGLFLTKHFVDSHKGSVWYESTPGKGSTFYIGLKKGNSHFNPEMIVDKNEGSSALLQELVEEPAAEISKNQLEEIVSAKQSMLVVDDDQQMREYVSSIFTQKFVVYQAENGSRGLEIAQKFTPNIIISDITMAEMNGMELCRAIKASPSLRHIPVLLLTGSASRETLLTGTELGADDYLTKPFEKDFLVARVDNILKNRNVLQDYFYNEITLQKNTLKISTDDQAFLNNCIQIVESHLGDNQFSIQTLVTEIGMSHSTLYQRVKTLSGQSVNGFIRFIRLRRAAELFISTDANVNEVAYTVGINDKKYFREQFNKLFGMNPSEYIKKFRKPFNASFTLSEKIIKP